MHKYNLIRKLLTGINKEGSGDKATQAIYPDIPYRICEINVK